jgi:hypothetical protein
MLAISKEIGAIVRQFGKDNPPHILLHSEPMDEERLASLYTACDAFVLPSRGEGFGLPFFEAGACGLPVVTTNCTAQSTLFTSSEVYFVEPDGYEQSTVQSPVNGALARWCRYYENQFFPKLGEKASDQLAGIMRQVAGNSTQAREMSARLREKIVQEYTWDHVAERVVRRLKSMKEEAQ